MKTLRYTPIVACFLLTACASLGNNLQTEYLRGSDIEQQKYNLFLYGRQTPHDVETVAVLDKVGDAYEFKPEGGDYLYNYHGNIGAAEALDKGEKFLEELINLNTIQRYAIVGPDDQTIGYELRPYFHPFQVDNSYYQSFYVLNEDNTVDFSVIWQDFYKPFVDEPN